MKYGPVSFTDKTGQEILLRNAELKDAEDLRRYLKITTGETPFLIREPEEVTLTLEQEEAFIRNNMEAERELLLLAFENGRHIGNCSLMSIGNYNRYRHRCGVAIALYKEYWGRGIGRKMLETVLDVAKECGYEQAELEVIADNQSAVTLYKSMGFQIHGTFPDNMKYKDGSFVDAYWMMKKL
ncbi:MAG: GNAT family N-acetyltransferase [Lachnospiraceae bacterium]|nr:GNAT family N-acetyltransferase [Lachnospiraceae bacterium]